MADTTFLVTFVVRVGEREEQSSQDKVAEAPFAAERGTQEFSHNTDWENAAKIAVDNIQH